MTAHPNAPRPSVMGVPHWHGPRDLHNHDNEETYNEGHEHGADLSIGATRFEGTWEQYSQTILPPVHDSEKRYERVSAQTGRGQGKVKVEE